MPHWFVPSAWHKSAPKEAKTLNMRHLWMKHIIQEIFKKTIIHLAKAKMLGEEDPKLKRKPDAALGYWNCHGSAPVSSGNLHLSWLHESAMSHPHTKCCLRLERTHTLRESSEIAEKNPQKYTFKGNYCVRSSQTRQTQQEKGWVFTLSMLLTHRILHYHLQYVWYWLAAITSH